MTDPEEESYSSIFSALKHPIRRKILRMLHERPTSFSEMLEAFKIESPHLTYHLEALGDLLYKTKDGKYGLSTFGEAATSMMYQVEEAPGAPPHLPSLPLKWKAVFAVLMIGLILLGGLSYAQYQALNQLSAEYEGSKAEVERLQQLLGQLFDLSNTILTDEYIFNGSAGREILFANHTVYTAGQYVIYNPFKNSTLEMKVSFFVPLPLNVSMLLSVTTGRLEWLFLRFKLVSSRYATPKDWRTYIRNWWPFIDIQTINVNNDGIFYVSLPSTGWYTLYFVPSFNIQGNYTTQYTISFRIKNQGTYIPFFVDLKDTLTFQFPFPTS